MPRPPRSPLGAEAGPGCRAHQPSAGEYQQEDLTYKDTAPPLEGPELSRRHGKERKPYGQIRVSTRRRQLECPEALKNLTKAIGRLRHPGRRVEHHRDKENTHPPLKG